MSALSKTILQVIGTAVLLLATPAFAAVTVGAGSSVNFADAVIDLGCSDLTIAGQGTGTSATLTGIIDLLLISGMFAPGASSVSLGGNFSDAGTFTAGSSHINVVDACGSGVSQVSGATNFHDLSVESANGKQLVLPANAIQGVEHALILQGAAGSLLQIVSSASGQHAQFAVANGATQLVAYVDARDNAATQATIAPGPASTYHSVDAGNLVNWFGNATGNPGPGIAPVPTPALSPLWLALLGLLLSGSSLLLFVERPAVPR
ncbi:hypothetical protein [Rudaea sp.]|uniref:hypothetical protein n=1 Tax=Rudaea sp. TaxID=2136325 RepID=UPI002ED5A07A